MKEYDKIMDALLSNPSLRLDEHIWIYEDNPTGNYYVRLARVEPMNRYNYRDDYFDKLVTEGTVSNIMEKYSEENTTVRIRKRD